MNKNNYIRIYLRRILIYVQPGQIFHLAILHDGCRKVVFPIIDFSFDTDFLYIGTPLLYNVNIRI